ncbi:MAG: hypothetical protein ACNA8W_20710 [Bradymonadaceae bacterium]
MQTPLHAAASTRDLGIVDLLRHGADTEAKRTETRSERARDFASKARDPTDCRGASRRPERRRARRAAPSTLARANRCSRPCRPILAVLGKHGGQWGYAGRRFLPMIRHPTSNSWKCAQRGRDR